MLTVDYPICNLDLAHRVGFTPNRLESLIQFSSLGFLLLLVQIDPLLYTPRNQPGLILGLSGPLAALGYLQGFTLCLR